MVVTAIGVGDRASHHLTVLPMIFGGDGVVLLRLSRQMCTGLLQISNPL
jgi:hypothetical protein